MLAAFGALADLALALPAMRFLERLVPEAMGAAHLNLDWRVLAFLEAFHLRNTDVGFKTENRCQ